MYIKQNRRSESIVIEFDYNILELQTRDQSFVDTRGNDYIKNQEYYKIEEEVIELNFWCEIDYDSDTHKEILIAFQNDVGKIGKLQQEVIDKKVWFETSLEKWNYA